MGSRNGVKGTGLQAEGGNADVTSLVVGAGVSLVGKTIGQGAYVLGQIILARLLGPQAFGLYAIGWTILRMAGALSSLGLDKGVIRYGSLYRPLDQARFKGVLLPAVGLAILVGALVGGGFYLAAPWLAGVFREPGLVAVIRCFSPVLVAYSGLRVAAAATTVSQQIKYTTYTQELGQPVVNLLLVVLFHLVGLELAGAVAAAILSFAAAFILALFYVRRLFPEAFSRRVKAVPVVREMVAYSLPASFAGLFGMLMIWVNRLLVGFFLPADVVGVFQAASQVPILFPLIASVFTVVLSPMIACLHHRRERERLDELYKVSTKWGLYLTLPVFLVICFAPRAVMTLVFGTRYESGWLPLVILATGQLINVGVGAIAPVLMMTGYQNCWFVTTGVAFLVSVTSSLVLIPGLGMPGATLGITCAVCGMSFAGLVQVRRRLGIWPYDHRYLKGLAATALVVGVLSLARTALVGLGIPGLVLLLVLSAGLFVLVLLLLGLDDEDRDFIRLLRARLRSRRADEESGSPAADVAG